MKNEENLGVLFLIIIELTLSTFGANTFIAEIEVKSEEEGDELELETEKKRQKVNPYHVPFEVVEKAYIDKVTRIGYLPNKISSNEISPSFSPRGVGTLIYSICFLGIQKKNDENYPVEEHFVRLVNSIYASMIIYFLYETFERTDLSPVKPILKKCLKIYMDENFDEDFDTENSEVCSKMWECTWKVFRILFNCGRFLVLCSEDDPIHERAHERPKHLSYL